MDDLVKQLEGASGSSGSSSAQGGALGGLENLLGGVLGSGGSASGQGPALGGLEHLLGSGGLANILGGALGGGLGGSVGGGAGGLIGGGLGAALPALIPSLLGMLGSRTATGQSGMHALLDGMHAQGLGTIAGSWVGAGENLPISAAQVAQAIGPEKLQQLSNESGLPPAQVGEGLAAILPHLVSHLTPDGQVPPADQVQASISALLRGGR